MPLTRTQETYIRSLHRSKGRKSAGQCLVEGAHAIELAKDAVEFTFTPEDTDRFDRLVTTKTPQPIAAVANIPQWTGDDIQSRNTILVLDHVQDPGNVGTILRLALGFNASILLINSADPVSPKCLRSSTGAAFVAPWMQIDASDMKAIIGSTHTLTRLEKVTDAKPITKMPDGPLAIILGSEGQGIQLDTAADSFYIPHDEALESLNVAIATGIALYQRQ